MTTYACWHAKRLPCAGQHTRGCVAHGHKGLEQAEATLLSPHPPTHPPTNTTTTTHSRTPRTYSCLALQLKVINGDNGYIVNGADFVTVTGVETDFTKQR